MFEVPFAALVVFATNLRPAICMDEAFLRRIHAKVRAQSPTAEEFARIFERYCATRGVAYDRPWSAMWAGARVSGSRA